MRMIRGAFRLTVRDFAEIADINKMTVVSMEGGKPAWARTQQKISSAFAPYVEFVDAVDGVRGPGIILKPGYEAIVRQSRGADDADGLDESCFGAASEERGFTPSMQRSGDVTQGRIARWRAHLARLSASTYGAPTSLLRAMGVRGL